MTIKSLLLSALVVATGAAAACAQPGPGPVPNPWVQNGNTLSWQGCLTIPVTVTGGCKGNGTINIGGGFYVAGVQVAIPGGSSGQVQTNNGSGGFAGITNTQLTAKINLATALLPGALPAWPNNTTTFFRGDGSYVTLNCAAITNAGTVCPQNTGTSGANVPLLNGANTWSGLQTIDLGTGLLPAALTGTLLRTANADATVSRVEVDGFGAQAFFSSVGFGGTRASPSALTSGTQIGGYNSHGYNGASVVGPVGTLRCFAAETWSSLPKQGTYCEVATTLNGGATLAAVMRWENDGGVTVPPTVTGGDKGVGTINATGLYVAGVQVATTAGGAVIPSIAQGDLLYGSAANVLSALSKDTNATRYLSNTGTSNNPAWAQINLANGVTGRVPFANLTQGATNTVLANITAGLADFVALSVASCDTATKALQWTTNTGFACNSAVNAATLGGATFAAPGAIGGGTPGSGAFTTVSANNQIKSTLSGGGVTSGLYTESSTNVAVGFGNTAGGADQKYWDFFLNGTNFCGRTVNDANNAAVCWLTVARGAGTAITSVAIPALLAARSIASNTGDFTLSHGLTNAANDLQVDGAFGFRNRLVNPRGQFNQAGSGTCSNGSYWFDQWLCLNQSNPVTPSQLTNVANGLPYMMRTTQSNASAQRFGIIQPIESSNVIDARGSTVTLSASVRMSASVNIRYAIVEWTGTADSPTKNVVNDWTSSTYTTGNFFISTTTTICGVGVTALTANTVATVTLTCTVSGSMNNLHAFFWTEATQAQNVTMDVGNIMLERAAVASNFGPRAFVQEQQLCYRYLQVYSVLGVTGVVNGVASLVARATAALGVPMRIAPTGGATAASGVGFFDGSAAVNSTGISTNYSTTTAFQADMLIPAGLTASRAAVAYDPGSAKWTLDARM